MDTRRWMARASVVAWEVRPIDAVSEPLRLSAQNSRQRDGRIMPLPTWPSGQSIDYLSFFVALNPLSLSIFAILLIDGQLVFCSIYFIKATKQGQHTHIRARRPWGEVFHYRTLYVNLGIIQICGWPPPHPVDESEHLQAVPLRVCMPVRPASATSHCVRPRVTKAPAWHSTKWTCFLCQPRRQRPISEKSHLCITASLIIAPTQSILVVIFHRSTWRFIGRPTMITIRGERSQGKTASASFAVYTSPQNHLTLLG